VLRYVTLLRDSVGPVAVTQTMTRNDSYISSSRSSVSPTGTPSTLQLSVDICGRQFVDLINRPGRLTDFILAISPQTTLK